MQTKEDLMIDPSLREAKLTEIKNAEVELDRLFQLSGEVQGQLHQLRPVALERYNALWRLHNFVVAERSTVRETLP